MFKKLLKIFTILLMFLSILLLIFESMTGVLSQILCQKFCGKSYIPSIEPQITDIACKFNTDMYLGFTLVLLVVLSIVMNVLSSREPVTEENQ